MGRLLCGNQFISEDMKKIMFNDHFGLTEAVLSGRETMTPVDGLVKMLDEK